MAKNYFNRYVWLIGLIQRYGYITLEEINRNWERCSLNETGEPLPERTFFHHKDAIKDIFKIEIRCDRTLGYYISNSDDIASDGIRQWMLQALSLSSLINESGSIRDRILYEDTPSSQKWLPDIIGAMKSSRMLDITYQGFTSANAWSFEISPLCIKLFRQRWYMLACSDAYPDPRIYALDRILELEQTDKSFVLPDGFDAEDTFSRLFGVITSSDPVEDITIKVREDQTCYYRTLPLHHTQEEGISNDGWTEFHYRLIPTYDFVRELLSKGDSIEVMSPKWLRKEIADELRRAAIYYSDVERRAGG